MDDMHAQSLQAQAIEALSNLRAWIWAQHATLLPDDVSTVTREQAERYSAYLEWYTTVETALQALEVAAPPFAEQCLPAAPRDTQPTYAPEPTEKAQRAGEEPALPPIPPTLRVTPAPRPLSRSGVWHRTIAISASASEESSARHSDARHSDARHSDARHSDARHCRRQSAA